MTERETALVAHVRYLIRAIAHDREEDILLAISWFEDAYGSDPTPNLGTEEDG
jgi:hypothetical protein